MKSIVILIATIAILVQAQAIGGPGTNIPGCVDYCIRPEIGDAGCSDALCSCRHEDAILSSSDSCLTKHCANSTEKADVITLVRAFCSALLANSTSSESPTSSPTSTPTSSPAGSSPAASDASDTAAPFVDTGASRSGLSTGAKAAIGVVVPVVVLALLGLAAFLYRRRRKAKSGVTTSEYDEKGMATRYAKHNPYDPPAFVELAGQPVSASKGKAEAPGEDLMRSELPGSEPGQKPSYTIATSGSPEQYTIPVMTTAGAVGPTAPQHSSVLSKHRSGDSIPVDVSVSTHKADSVVPQSRAFRANTIDEAQAAHVIHVGPQTTDPAPSERTASEVPASESTKNPNVSPPISPPASPPLPNSTTSPPPQRAKSLIVQKPGWQGE
ncbi:hypothetical protein EJ05DRAFT_142275 [Pseudovirgaria hyperparasitica]|uniref:CFEM domain-containing protein n=1 Tax=Pseudovirgaria hyperparasitica TaxID=470096 RepID=A0A6A6VV71_9PEZI|nr:uncharacterized protein EJ05DRAFT_142275 [Pseudovirgaria hyperparasitica]KAF2754462.1 hypothetical protein EJ05DRAFT_142275 [Pseudovirgaria hyperparasitica]